LAGLITGYIFSIAIKTPEYQKTVFYEWERPDYNSEDDQFMKHFDENGNFRNLPKLEDIEVVDAEYFRSNFDVVYTVIPFNYLAEIPEENSEIKE